MGLIVETEVTTVDPEVSDPEGVAEAGPCVAADVDLLEVLHDVETSWDVSTLLPELFKAKSKPSSLSSGVEEGEEAAGGRVTDLQTAWLDGPVLIPSPVELEHLRKGTRHWDGLPALLHVPKRTVELRGSFAVNDAPHPSPLPGAHDGHKRRHVHVRTHPRPKPIT